MSDNIITLNSEQIHTELKDLVRNSVEETLNSLLDAEADRLVNAERYALAASRADSVQAPLTRKELYRCVMVKAVKYKIEFAKNY